MRKPLSALGRLAFVFILAAAWPTASAWAQGQTINFRDADIQAFIDDISMLTGRMFIVDPRVKGKVTVYSQEPITNEEAFQVFLSTLRVHGYAAIPTASGAFKIVPDETASQDSSPVADERLSGDQFATQVFRLRFVDAQDALSALKPLIHRQGQLTANARSNALIVADYAANLKRLRQVIAELDQDTSQIETIRLRNTTATEMARIVASLGGGPGKNGIGDLNYSVVAVESSNSLLIKGDRQTLEQLRPVIRRLDQISESSDDLSVIYLKHADAEQLVPILEQVSQSLTAAAPVTAEGAPSRPAGIAFHQPTNALIINADPETQKALAGVIRQLDIRRAQVLVEAIIVEISDTAARELGLQYLLGGDGGNTVPFSATNFSRSAPNLLAVAGALITDNGSLTGGDFSSTTTNNDATTVTRLSPVAQGLQEAAVASLLGLEGFSLGFGGQTNDGTIFGVILTAVDQDAASNVLSTPSVMTLDNEEASIQVGQQIPISTGETLGDANLNPFRTIERQDVGIQLEVRPQINEGDSITLFIRQEVSSIFGPVSETFTELITNRREVSTTVLADDGEVIVLGGLIEENEQISASQVPLLGDIPGIGRLFSSKGRSNVRSNLMVFIRPTIVRDVEDVRAVTSRKYNYLQAEQLLRTRQPTSSMDRVMNDILGREPEPADARPGAAPGADVGSPPPAAEEGP